MNIISPAQGEVDQPRGNRGIGIAINQDKGASVSIVLVRLEGHGMIQRKIADADVIQFQSFCCQMLQGIHIDLIFQRTDLRSSCLKSHLDQVLSARQKRFVMHPNELGFKLIGNGWTGTRVTK